VGVLDLFVGVMDRPGAGNQVVWSEGFRSFVFDNAFVAKAEFDREDWLDAGESDELLLLFDAATGSRECCPADMVGEFNV
jgi:hypothetical protein